MGEIKMNTTNNKQTHQKALLNLKEFCQYIVIGQTIARELLNDLANSFTRVEEDDRKVLMVEEYKNFFECCKGTFYDNLFLVAVSSGLRIGELAALRESDLDFANRMIVVIRTLVYQKLDGDAKKEFHLGSPKTKTSVRKVPISSVCENDLRKQLLQKKIIANRNIKSVDKEFKNLIFTTRYNTPLNT